MLLQYLMFRMNARVVNVNADKKGIVRDVYVKPFPN